MSPSVTYKLDSSTQLTSRRLTNLMPNLLTPDVHCTIQTNYLTCLVFKFAASQFRGWADTVCAELLLSSMVSNVKRACLSDFNSSVCVAALVRASSWWKVLLCSCSRVAVTKVRKHSHTTNMQVRTTRYSIQKALIRSHIIQLNFSAELLNL